MQLSLAVIVGMALGLSTNLAIAQDCFHGNTIRLIVGTNAGGGFDSYSLTIAYHFGKHIPGNPAVIVENLPGAAHLISANYLYQVAKPGGFIIGNVAGTLLLGQVLGAPGIQVDPKGFEYGEVDGVYGLELHQRDLAQSFRNLGSQGGRSSDATRVPGDG